ncbi:MAG TPA: ribosome maturation factor RimM [Candidatus Eisenbacteria bacterium]|nr:ribosome maturation factor RimM [Candidatus Eisenbacteria bacterium]
MPTDAGDEPILVGTVARAHGLTGEVVVDSWSDAPERFAPGSVLSARLSEGDPRRRLQVASSRPFGGRLLVRFEGVDSRTDAEALRGADLTIPRCEAKPLPEGEHYRFELVGLRARTPAGEPIGEVAGVFTTGANDVIVVRGARGEILIPLIPGVIESVDVPGGSITMNPPAGLPGWDD